jgi:hypothetical protein
MHDYKLVNPVIAGTFIDTYKAANAEQAAEKFWNQLAGGKYIAGDMPLFYFTIMDGANEKLSHFKLEEKREGSHASYTISAVKGTTPAKLGDAQFLSKYKEVTKKLGSQLGGKHKRHNKHDDSSSSSDSDSDDDDLFKYIRAKQAVRPIVYWWWTPSLYDVNTVFTPTFVAPISPYTQLWLPY